MRKMSPPPRPAVFTSAQTRCAVQHRTRVKMRPLWLCVHHSHIASAVPRAASRACGAASFRASFALDADPGTRPCDAARRGPSRGVSRTQQRSAPPRADRFNSTRVAARVAVMRSVHACYGHAYVNVGDFHLEAPVRQQDVPSSMCPSVWMPHATPKHRASRHAAAARLARDAVDAEDANEQDADPPSACAYRVS